MNLLTKAEVKSLQQGDIINWIKNNGFKATVTVRHNSQDSLEWSGIDVDVVGQTFYEYPQWQGKRFEENGLIYDDPLYPDEYEGFYR